MGIDGIFNLSKPCGKTSFDIVAAVRRISGERRVGHAGTLDPAATGVLPICLGQGTRIIEFLMDTRKTYQAEIELGTVTDTYDAEGRIINQRDASHITKEQLLEVLPRFRGPISQLPPMYSAVKQQGRPLYELARAGKEVVRTPRTVELFRLELLEWHPRTFTVEVECSKGTYIRSLAYDIGEALGSGAYLKGLARLKSGPFCLDDALTLEDLELAFQYGYWDKLIYPLDFPLLSWRAAIVGEESEYALRNGRPLPLGQDGSVRCRAYGANGQMIAILRFVAEKGLWHPEKVFPQISEQTAA